MFLFSPFIGPLATRFESLKSSKSRLQGFSLVETVLALGIVAFASTVVLGLLPIGLTAFHNTVDETMASQIVSSITTQAAQTDFSDLANLAPLSPSPPSQLYYDDEGQPVVTASQALYTAIVYRKTSSGVMASGNLATIEVDIYTTRGATFNAATMAHLLSSSYTIRVANMGL